MKISAPLLLQEMQVSAMKLAPPVEGEGTTAADLIPDELRDWLVRLRLLHDVPFAYFVADTELLPAESIRWFYVDRRWTDALVQGALSVGTVNTDDRLQLTQRYDEIRDALDEAERNVRKQPDAPWLAGSASALSGFILRSAAVSGWPGMHVRAFREPPTNGDGFDYDDNHPMRMRLLRLERLAPAVLLCLFDGIPKEVHIQEPRQGVQFGVEEDPIVNNSLSANVPVRTWTATTITTHDDTKVPVKFRPGAPGVVDIQRLERDLAAAGGAGGDAKLDSAEYALQMIRFPYRRIYGQPGVAHPNLTPLLKATVVYQSLATELFTSGVTPP